MIWHLLFGNLTDRATEAGLHHLCWVFAALTGFGVSLVAGAILIGAFRKRQVFEDTAQPDHDGLNAIQNSRTRVPTMGGLMILVGILVSAMLWGDVGRPILWVALGVMAALGLIGFVDDYIKLTRPKARGLTMKGKFFLQCIIGALAGWAVMGFVGGENARTLLLPFAEVGLPLGSWAIVWIAFIIVLTSNAVNLADGIDGLAGGCTVIAAAALFALGMFARGDSQVLAGASEMYVLAAATVGAVLGFLWYNSQPAQVFMGDTGSLALGGLLAVMALALKLEIPLILAGAVFYIDALTVFLQIAGFKATKKRIFPIAPIHHVFQLRFKWPDQRITVRLWIVAAVGAVASFALVKLRGS
jgi:phospho-N-acetylmuramoyl-pentapeptide-transferase